MKLRCAVWTVLLLWASASASASLIWGDASGKLSTSGLDGTAAHTLISTGVTTPIAVAADTLNGRVYWSDVAEHNIKRANFDGSAQQVIFTETQSGFGSIQGVAIDAAAGRIYWADASGKISRALLDGSSAQVLVSTGVTTPIALALDLTAGKMYWSDVAERNIKSANLDGSSIDVTFTETESGFGSIQGLAVDGSNQRLYWTDASGRVSRAALNGTGVERIVTSGVTTPIAIALDQAHSKLYWSDVAERNIKRSNLDGSGLETIFSESVSGFGSIQGLAVVPEPSSVALTLAIGILALRRRRHVGISRS